MHRSSTVRTAFLVVVLLVGLACLVGVPAANAGETGAPGALVPVPASSGARARVPTAHRDATPAASGRTTTTSAVASAPETRSAPPDTARGSADREPPPVDTRAGFAPLLGIASEGLGFAIGARGGVTLPMRVHVGGTAVYHAGSSYGGASAVDGAVYGTRVSTSAFYVGPEGGYDFVLRAVTIRPFLGLGVGTFFASTNMAGASTSVSDTRLVAWPGCAVLYDVPESTFFVGGDARLVTVPSAASFAAFGFFGMRVGS